MAVVRKCLSEMVCHWRQFSLYIVVYTFVYIYICICLWFCICLKTWCSGGCGGGSEVLEGNGSWLETIQSTIHRWSLKAIPGEETFAKRKRENYQTFWGALLFVFSNLLFLSSWVSEFLEDKQIWYSCSKAFLVICYYFWRDSWDLPFLVYSSSVLWKWREFDEFILSLRPDIEFVGHIISST